LEDKRINVSEVKKEDYYDDSDSNDNGSPQNGVAVGKLGSLSIDALAAKAKKALQMPKRVEEEAQENSSAD
jgi:hypothetical protein